MSYINADIVLPKELIKEIQKYVNGVNLYIHPKCRKRRGPAAATGWNYPGETGKYTSCLCRVKRFRNWPRPIFFPKRAYTGFWGR